ncbi:E3 ubiquitin-protein ligase sh3rf1 [Phlyctochytrium bullatum]|nr:E3 ubiquitin-protein ligase sh3rf1 [Phlyctochytrium bullatum]
MLDAFQEHLVASIATDVAALLKHGWIDQSAHDAIIKLLPTASNTPAPAAPGPAAPGPAVPAPAAAPAGPPAVPVKSVPPPMPATPSPAAPPPAAAQPAPPPQAQGPPPTPTRPPPTAPRPASLVSLNAQPEAPPVTSPRSSAPTPAHPSHPPVQSQPPPAAPARVSSTAASNPPPALPGGGSRKSLASSNFRVAVKDFISKEEGDLSFNAGDVIEITGEVDENWLQGSLKGKTGIFPKKFTEPKQAVPPPIIPPVGPPAHPSSSGQSSPQRTSITASQGSLGPPTRPPPLAPKPNRPSSIAKEPSTELVDLFHIHHKLNGNLLAVDAAKLKSLLAGSDVGPGLHLSVLSPEELQSANGTLSALTFSHDKDSHAVAPHVVGENGEPVHLELRLKEANCGGEVLLTRKGGNAGPGGGVNVPAGGVRLFMPPGPKAGGGAASTVAVGGWKLNADGGLQSDRGGWFGVDDMGKLVVWDEQLEDQNWELLAV